MVPPALGCLALVIVLEASFGCQSVSPSEDLFQVKKQEEEEEGVGGKR